MNSVVFFPSYFDAHLINQFTFFKLTLYFINVVIRGMRLTKAYAFMKSTNMRMVGWCLRGLYSSAVFILLICLRVETVRSGAC